MTRNGSCRAEAGAEELVNVTLITHQYGTNGTIEAVTPKAV